MKIYLEDEAWVSCTFDLAGTPRQLGKTKERKVVHSNNGNKELLTVEDRYITEQFKCKLTAKQWGGLFALIGGAVVGFVGAVVVLAAVVLSGPVGWCIFGAIATAAIIGTVTGSIATGIALACNDCTDPLKAGKWNNASETVFINKEAAIFYNVSTLDCSNGGILLASRSKEDANKLSNDMKWNARFELGAQILSNAISGGVAGLGTLDQDGDLDLATVPLAIASYIDNDFLHPERTPKDAAIRGLWYSAAGYGLGYAKYIPGAPPFLGNVGTEFSVTDLVTTGVMTMLGYASDKLEEWLNDNNEEIIDKEKGNLPEFGNGDIVAEK